MIPAQHRIAARSGGDMHAPSRTGSSKAATVGDSLQCTPEEQQKWQPIKQQFANALNNGALPTGQLSVRRPLRLIQLVLGATPSFVPRYRRAPQLEDEVERQAVESLKKGNVKGSTNAFGYNRVLARKKNGR